MTLSRKEALLLYCKLISKRIREPVSTKIWGITEVHHIIPKCVVGWKKIRDSKYNLIRLYSHEHFLAHYYLTIIFPDNIGLHRAFYLMGNLKNKRRYKNINELAKAYEVAKNAIFLQRTQQTYVKLYGKTRAEKIKIKQKWKKIDYMIRIIPVDK